MPTMTNGHTHQTVARKPLRLWPGVITVALQWLLWFALPLVMPEAIGAAFFGGMLCTLAFILWWLFFSRAPWLERLGVIVLMVVAVMATSPILHRSIQNGMMGMMFYVHVIPALCLALVVWAMASRRLAAGPRFASLVAAILLACGAFTLLRTEGLTGDAVSAFKWRWSKTPEEQMLTRADEPRAKSVTPAAANTAADWPGFRGPSRDSVVRGARINTGWAASPPVEMWRRPIGPAWSSFAVQGDLLYTQEQRGEEEVVSCYSLANGEPVWRHSDAARFWESNAGAGPRGTPTLSNGRVYTFGGTGILNALDAGDGAVVWSRNAATDTGAKVPGWGFAASPLVVDDMVVVAAAGDLAAYDAATGDPRWFGPKGRSGYSSPHLLTIDGVAQILLLSGAGATSFAPADGQVLWEDPSSPGGVRIVQPALTAEGDILIHDAIYAGTGMRRVAVANGAGGWTVEQRWTTNLLKPYFNDFVVHEGHAYGFDGSRLACIDVKDGQRRWKGGQYGYGQLLLLPDQDVLLVLSEKGELALVSAIPDQLTELARFPAIEGKTWNHPVLVGDVLLVRNDREMAAFRLSLVR